MWYPIIPASERSNFANASLQPQTPSNAAQSTDNMATRGNGQPTKRKQREPELCTQEDDNASARKRPRQSNSQLAQVHSYDPRRFPQGQTPEKDSETLHNPRSVQPILHSQSQFQNSAQLGNTQSVRVSTSIIPRAQSIKLPSPLPIPARPRHEDEYTFEILRDNPVLAFVMDRSIDLDMNMPVLECLRLCKKRLLEYPEHAQLEFVQPRDNDVPSARDQRRGARLLIREIRGGEWDMDK